MNNSFFHCFPWWPIYPPIRINVLGDILMLAAVIFSLVMLIDCLKRKPADFVHPLTKNAEYDKLIWAIGILISLSLYCIGAIAYFFVVKRAKKQEDKKE